VWRVKDSNLGRHQPTDLQPERTVSLTWGKALGVCSVGTHSAQRSDVGPKYIPDKIVSTSALAWLLGADVGAFLLHRRLRV
jgi:hypothetical protein